MDRKNSAGRYRSIDGIRGLAALAVVFYHLSGSLSAELSALLPDIVNAFFSYGYLGVPIFFVISGFVISISVGSATINRGYFGRFVLRRSIRLDVTCWASIVLALVLLFVKNNFLNQDVTWPSFTDVSLHIFYLQDFFSGYGSYLICLLDPLPGSSVLPLFHTVALAFAAPPLQYVGI